MTTTLRRRRGRWRVAALATACLVLLAGCKTTAWVRVDVRPDGSGTVTVDVYLDAEAVAAVGDLSSVLVTDDLEKAGWKVTGPAAPDKVDPEAATAGGAGDDRSGADGSSGFAVQVRLEHPFANVDEANRILASLGGPDGPFRDVTLTRDESRFSTSLGFTGTVDLSKGLDTFGDADLAKVLGGNLSDTVAASGTKVPTGDELTVGLQVVPSKSLDWSGEMGNESMGGKTVSATVALGEGPETIDVHASKTRTGSVIAAVMIVLCLVGGFALRIVAVRMRRKQRRGHRSGQGTRHRSSEAITLPSFDADDADPPNRDVTDPT